MEENKKGFIEKLYSLFCQFMNRWNKENKDVPSYTESKIKTDELLKNNKIKDKINIIKTDSNIITFNNKKIKIIQNLNIRDTYKDLTKWSWNKRTRKISSIKEIVLHATAGCQSAKSLMNWMKGYNGKQAERHNEYKKSIALFHFLIDYNGDIYEIIPIENYVLHSSSGTKWDKHTIGIELMKSDSKNKISPTKKQYESLFALIIGRLIPINLNCNRVSTHQYNIWKYRKVQPYNCPGTFDFKLLDKELKKHNYNFKTYCDLRYEIKKEGI